MDNDKNNNTEQEVIQNNTVEVPGWVLYTLLQHLEVSWDSKSLTIPQTEVAINSYRLGSRLLREMINSKKTEHNGTLMTTEDTTNVQNKPELTAEKTKKKRKPKK
jgi:hypothetical protein